MKRVATGVRMHRGHTLFKINEETLEISKAEFSTLPIKDENGKPVTSKSRRVISEDGYFYRSALNEQSLKRKLIKLGIAVEVKE